MERANGAQKNAAVPARLLETVSMSGQAMKLERCGKSLTRPIIVWHFLQDCEEVGDSPAALFSHGANPKWSCATPRASQLHIGLPKTQYEAFVQDIARDSMH